MALSNGVKINALRAPIPSIKRNIVFHSVYTYKALDQYQVAEIILYS